MGLLNWRTFLSTVLILSVSALDVSAQPKLLYRYINDDGNKVLNYHIPPKYAQRGYEVVNEHGDVLRVVNPSLTQQELDAAQQARLEQEALEKWDRDLLRRYSTVSDVEAAKARRLAEIDSNLAILRGTIRGLDSQIAREQAKAAERERRGQAVPESILVNIDNFYKERSAAERMIENRQQDYDAVAERFNRDIERFQIILGRMGGG
jgi:vancomycin resistance protein YoaR